jgi:hypothetical protein
MHSVTFRTGSVGLLVSWPVQPERVQRPDAKERALNAVALHACIHHVVHNLRPRPVPRHSSL